MSAHKPAIQEIIVVEGTYDKNTLLQVVDALVIETRGFRIFKDPETRQLLRTLADTRGVIVLTDSDSAGFMIRNHLKGCIDPQRIKQAYIPDIYGRERRKRQDSKEGKLGVEGMSPEIILKSLQQAGATFIDVNRDVNNYMPRDGAAGTLTKADAYALGLTGRPDSAQRRKQLQRYLQLPAHLTANALLDILNLLYTPQQVREMLETVQSQINN